MRNEEGFWGGNLAGWSGDTRGPQLDGVLLLNPSDERGIAWFIDEASFDVVEQARGDIAHNRKPHPTEPARVLGLWIPESVAVMPYQQHMIGHANYSFCYLATADK